MVGRWKCNLPALSGLLDCIRNSFSGQTSAESPFGPFLASLSLSAIKLIEIVSIIGSRAEGGNGDEGSADKCRSRIEWRKNILINAHCCSEIFIARLCGAERRIYIIFRREAIARTIEKSTHTRMAKLIDRCSIIATIKYKYRAIKRRKSGI